MVMPGHRSDLLLPHVQSECLVLEDASLPQIHPVPISLERDAGSVRCGAGRAGLSISVAAARAGADWPFGFSCAGMDRCGPVGLDAGILRLASHAGTRSTA